MKVRFVIEDSKGRTVELFWDEMMELLKKLQNLNYEQLEKESFTFSYTPDSFTTPNDTGTKYPDSGWGTNKDDPRWEPEDHKYTSKGD